MELSTALGKWWWRNMVEDHVKETAGNLGVAIHTTVQVSTYCSILLSQSVREQVQVDYLFLPPPQYMVGGVIGQSGQTAVLPVTVAHRRDQGSATTPHQPMEVGTVREWPKRSVPVWKDHAQVSLVERDCYY